MTNYENITLKTWDEARDLLRQHYVRPSFDYLERAKQAKYPSDAFSLGQTLSKSWLIQATVTVMHLSEELDLASREADSPPTIAILGCWFGSLVDVWLDAYPCVERIYGLDMDPSAVLLSEEFNAHHVENNWKFKGVVANVETLNTSKMMFETGGELIQTQPSIIINTSCEHMGTHWFDTADGRQLIIMQTNDNPNLIGHVNTCSSISEMNDKYPLAEQLYCGALELPTYTRYMQIGYKDGRH